MKNYNKLNSVLAFLMLIFTIITCLFLPDRVVIHTSDFQNIDGWGSKYTNLIFPVIMLILWYFMPYIMKQKEKKVRALDEISQKQYINKNKTIVNIIFLLLTFLDVYWIAQEFQVSQYHISLASWLLIGDAMLYLVAVAFVFLLTRDELSKLHWKEFSPADDIHQIERNKKLILIFGSCCAFLILCDAVFSGGSIILAILLFVLLAVKFLYGVLLKRMDIR